MGVRLYKPKALSSTILRIALKETKVNHSPVGLALPTQGGSCDRAVVGIKETSEFLLDLEGLLHTHLK